MRIFFDSEFTGLRQDTTLISIGLVADDGNMFYAEFTDYDKTQVFDWLQENVINNLWLSNPELPQPRYLEQNKLDTCLGDKEKVALALRQWFSRWERVDEIWGDIIPFDWVLLCGLLGGIFNLPNNLPFICYDICTLLKIKGMEPTINREEFVGFAGVENKHNALYDALVVKECYEKLMGID